MQIMQNAKRFEDPHCWCVHYILQKQQGSRILTLMHTDTTHYKNSKV